MSWVGLSRRLSLGIMKNKYIRSLHKLVNRLLYGRNDAFYIDLFVNGEMSSPTALPSEKKRWEVLGRFIEEAVVPEHGDMLKILDLGCGRGWMSNLLAKYGEVVGCDPVSGVIEYAKELYPALTFHVGTHERMLQQYGPSSMHLVVSSEVIEHIPLSDRRTYIENIHAILGPRGFCIISTPRGEVEDNVPRGFDQPVENWMTEQEVATLFSTGGFGAIRMERIKVGGTDLYQVWIFRKLGKAGQQE